MKKLTTVVLLVSALLFGPRAGQARALTADTKPGLAPCAGIDWRRGVLARERLIRCLFSGRGIPGGVRKALAVARCESGPTLNPQALYDGEYAGLYQHALTYWDDRADRYPLWRFGIRPERANPMNAYHNAVMTLFMVRQSGWVAWSCA